jgi:predicted PP-loop superfamily ATPase
MSKIKKEFSKIAAETAAKLRLETNLDSLQEYILTDCLDVIDGSMKSKFELIKKCHNRLNEKINKITKNEAIGNEVAVITCPVSL